MFGYRVACLYVTRARNLKVHSYYSDTADELAVYLPVRCYELTLKHRLLEQLGGFSHLLLDALTLLPEQGMEWVLDVTGLSAEQLRPVLTRMEGLGLIREARLSQHGKKLCNWKRLLHGQTRCVWLDAQHNSHTFCADASLGVASVPETEDAFVIRSWHRKTGHPGAWSCHGKEEDCERQKSRIMKFPVEYLGASFNTFHACFHETGFNAHEWDLSVRYMPPENGQMEAIKVPLEVTDLRPGVSAEYTLASPALCLDTTYSLPDGAPARFHGFRPENYRHIVSFSSAPIVPEQLLDEPPSSWSWPKVDAIDRQQAVEHLFEKLSLSSPAENEIYFNRTHALLDRWQALGFDWATVMKRLHAIDGIHLIKAEQ